MKKLFNITLLLLISSVFIFSSCSKDDDKDDRDKFIGSYTYVMQGTVVATYGTNTMSEPWLDNGNLVITKSSTSSNTIIMNDDGEITEYTVSGNNISSSHAYNEQGINVQVYETGSLSGNTLTITIQGSGSGTQNDITMGIKMNAVVTATKK